MNPTLRHSDLLEVAPYGGRPVRRGDVVVACSPGTAVLVVHRVADVSPQGIRLRGDNSTAHDPDLLRQPDIAGRVVAAWRGQTRRRVACGAQGRLVGILSWWTTSFDRHVLRLLRAPYRTLARTGILARVLPPSLRPRVVVFPASGGNQMRLVLGRHVIGRHDVQRGKWHIQRPFHLLVDECVLPRRPENTPPECH